MSLEKGQDQIMRILNTMLKFFSLNPECDIFGRYSSGDVLQHRRVSGSGGWCQVGNRHLEDIKVQWLMKLLVAGQGVGGSHRERGRFGMKRVG